MKTSGNPEEFPPSSGASVIRPPANRRPKLKRGGGGVGGGEASLTRSAFKLGNSNYE